MPSQGLSETEQNQLDQLLSDDGEDLFMAQEDGNSTWDQSGEGDGDPFETDDEEEELGTGEPDDSQELDHENEESSTSYKELQRKFTEVTEDRKTTASELERLRDSAAPYGGVEQMINLVRYVTSDPKISKVLESHLNGEDISEPVVDTEGFTEPQKQVADLVTGIVDKVLEAKLGPRLDQFRSESVEPLMEESRERDLETVISQMDTTHGVEWREHLPEITQLAEEEGLSGKPTLDIAERLYVTALKKAGKYEDFVLAQAEKIKSAKRAKATPRPRSNSGNVTSGKTAPKKIRNMFDAAASVANRNKRIR
jgi:hypothetical protein